MLRDKSAYLVMVTVCVLLLSACSPVKTDTTGAVGNGPPIEMSTAVPELAELVPEEYADRGYLNVVTTVGMAPLNIPDSATGQIEGFNPDLARHIAAVLDLEVKLSGASIDQIIPGMQAGRYDITFSNMAINDERLEVLDFVEYYFSGSALGVLEGNPLGLDADNLCGRAVGVSNGSYQMTKVLPKVSDECLQKAQSAISIQAYPDQQKAALALLSGRIDAVCMDGPVLAYATTQEPRLEKAANMTNGSHIGIGVNKHDRLVDAVQKALQYLIDTGVYEQLLERYGINDLGIEKAEVYS